MQQRATAGERYTCPGCARVLTVYVALPAAPVCTRCNRQMQPAPGSAMAGQLALFNERALQRRKQKR
jgi:hypothetical protein